MKNILIAFISLLCTAHSIKIYAQSDERPPISPLWVYEPWVWEDSLNNEIGVMRLVNEYQQNQIPVGAIIIDSPWSLSYNDFVWDKSKYPNPKNLIRLLRKRGVRTVMWLTGCVNSESVDTKNQRSPDLEFVKSKGYAVNRGKESKWWKGKGVHIDFTNPQASKWWNSKLDELLKLGVYGWKVDQGEIYFGDNVETSKGTMSNEDFRPYYYRAIVEHSLKRNPNSMILGRGYSHQGGYAAAAKDLTVSWSGDFSGNWEGLKLQIDNIYTSAQKGYGALACEIGGFFNEKSTRKQFIRYAQFGSLCPVMINGGSNGPFSTHLPWYFGDDVTDIYRFYATLHTELSPYLFSVGVDAHNSGKSMLISSSHQDHSHKLGESIFVKALISDEDKTTIKMPSEGEWIDYWTGKTYAAGQEIELQYNDMQYPIFIKSGAIIPMHIQSDVTGLGDTSFKGKQTFLIYPNATSRLTYHKPTGEGISYDDIEVIVNADQRSISVNAHINEDCIFLIKDINGQTKRIEKKGQSFSFSY